MICDISDFTFLFILDMGNVASWSGTKTLTCFEFYDQAFANCFSSGKKGFSSIISVNWGTLQNTANGLTMDGPTVGHTMEAPGTRAPFKRVENEGSESLATWKNFRL